MSVTTNLFVQCKTLHIIIEVDNLSKYTQNIIEVCINIDGIHKQVDYMM